jgi:polysaccharide pyruvyl transferase WcaK-like protein
MKEWGLPACAKVLGVNVLGEKHVLAQEPRLFEKLGELLDLLIEQHNVFIVFLSNEVREGATFDKASAIRTLAEMKRQNQAFIAPNDYLAPQQMLSLIANCHATISMRYHFCLFSALQGVPFIALQRSDKVADLCEDLQWEGGVPTKELAASRLGPLFDGLERKRGDLVRHLHNRLRLLRQRAGKNLTALECAASRPEMSRVAAAAAAI